MAWRIGDGGCGLGPGQDPAFPCDDDFINEDTQEAVTVYSASYRHFSMPFTVRSLDELRALDGVGEIKYKGVWDAASGEFVKKKKKKRPGWLNGLGSFEAAPHVSKHGLTWRRMGNKSVALQKVARPGFSDAARIEVWARGKGSKAKRPYDIALRDLKTGETVHLDQVVGAAEMLDAVDRLIDTGEIVLQSEESRGSSFTKAVRSRQRLTQEKRSWPKWKETWSKLE